MGEVNGDYERVRCGVCGKPWEYHTPDCSRHAHRPEPPEVKALKAEVERLTVRGEALAEVLETVSGIADMGKQAIARELERTESRIMESRAKGIR